MTDKEDSSLCSTCTILFFHALFTVPSVIFYIGHFFFSPTNSEEWKAGCAVLVSSLLIFGVLRLLKLLMDYLHTKFRIGELRRYKNSLFIGLGGIAICGWVPRIAIYFVATNNLAFWCYMLISPMALFIFYNEFIRFIDNWELNFKKQEKFIYGLIVTHVIALIITIRIGSTCYTQENGQTEVILCQLGFSFICLSSMIELCMVLMGEIKLTKKGDENQRRAQNTENYRNNSNEINAENAETGALESVRVVGAVKTVFVYPRMECGICLLEYDDTYRTPRILKECGHTVCQDCADKLLKQNNGRVIFCPFCQNATVVNGPASLLPKNYVAMEPIQNRKND